MALTQRLEFIRGYLRNPGAVGAIAPSSQRLAQALCEPYRRYPRPAKVLEVGAGTGAITRYLGSVLEKGDRLDVCEIEPEFADILEREVLTRPEFAMAVSEGRVRLLRAPVQQLPSDTQYDFVISGLPLTAFTLRDVRDVFGVIQRILKPGGVLSYFEYVALRRTTRTLALGERRKRIRMVSAFLTRRIRRHQFSTKTVLTNFPPAHARHLRFEKNGPLATPLPQ